MIVDFRNPDPLYSCCCSQDQSNYVAEFLDSKRLKLDGVVCTAGGWAGGSLYEQSGLESVQSMWEMNVQSAVMGTASFYVVSKRIPHPPDSFNFPSTPSFPTSYFSRLPQ